MHALPQLFVLGIGWICAFEPVPFHCVLPGRI